MNYPMKELDKAIQEAENWAVSGWTMTFGPYQTEVNSKEAAEALPETMHNRLEANNYWNDVHAVGGETAEQGRKAKEALQKGDVGTAINAIYFACYIEKRINDKTPTWGPVYSALEKIPRER